MKFILTHLFILFSLSIYSQSQISAEDLALMVGNWEGKITYLDYQSNKPFTMDANLKVEKGKNEKKLVLNNIYPSEPKANNTNKYKLTKNGTFFNKHRVTKREKLANGQVEIHTEYKGKDDNKKALIRYTYLVSKDIFSITKEVQFNQEEAWIKRSEYSYLRKK